MPRWVVDALARVTPDGRVSAALEELGEASLALNDGRFHASLRHASRAKELAPRDATVREVLALAAYRVGDWATALRELRTYRRLSGEATHLPIEMDVLRALGRPNDVDKSWLLLSDLEVPPTVKKEGAVVYASFLLDEGRLVEARKLMAPPRLKSDPHPEDLRLWYVGARAAARDGDAAEAVRLRDAISVADPSFPGLDELDLEISSSSETP